MNIAIYIAKRIAFNSEKSFSRFIIRLSIGATAISVAAMILTLCFVNGFQYSITNKVYSFWGHIRVQHYNIGRALVAEEIPILSNDTVENILKKNKEIKAIQPFATKATVLQFKNEIEGCLIKGINHQYDSSLIKSSIQQGRWLHFNDTTYSKEIVLSVPLANLLQAKINDTVKVNFIQNNESSTYRKLKVVGIYKTGIEEYDKQFIIADLKLLQTVNNWTNNQIGGYEILVHQTNNIDAVIDSLQLPIEWQGKSIKQVYINIFDWLQAMNVNRDVVFVIMGIVAVINLITCLLILVLERTKMVGILKALGSSDTSIQTIFLYYASIIAFAGICLGLIIGLGLGFLQQQFGFIKLDEANYMVNIAPIKFIWWQNVLIIIVTALVCFLAFIIPTFLVKKIKPIQAIRFN
ncbi:MAG: ABC transporter permease [Chitinophagaceae bacterium]